MNAVTLYACACWVGAIRSGLRGSVEKTESKSSLSVSGHEDATGPHTGPTRTTLDFYYIEDVMHICQHFAVSEVETVTGD